MLHQAHGRPDPRAGTSVTAVNMATDIPRLLSEGVQNTQHKYLFFNKKFYPFKRTKIC